MGVMERVCDSALMCVQLLRMTTSISVVVEMCDIEEMTNTNAEGKRWC